MGLTIFKTVPFDRSGTPPSARIVAPQAGARPRYDFVTEDVAFRRAPATFSGEVVTILYRGQAPDVPC